MGSPEQAKISVKKDIEFDSDIKIERLREDDEWEDDDRRKHRSSKSRKPGIDEEAEGVDSSGRKKGSGDRSESRKRSGGSSRADSDEDDYETRKETHSRHVKKKTEENPLEKLTNRYQEGEFSERREGSREKGHGSSDHGRNSRRRWDDSDVAWKGEDSNYVEKSDVRGGRPVKLDSVRLRSDTLKIDESESKIRESDSDGDKLIKSQEWEDKKSEAENSKRDRFDASEEDVKGASLTRSTKERLEEHGQQRNSSGRDIVDSHERSVNADEDGSAWMRDKSRREIDTLRRSRTPDRNGRRQHELENYDMDYERSNSFRRKEQDRDGYRDDRSKARDESWIDRSRDREGSRDSWRRRQPNNADKEIKDMDTGYDHGREWDLPRRGRIDQERPQGRSGGRKDGNRTEAVKTSSKYGISNDNYDVIEIQTKPFDYGREESKSILPRSNEPGQQSDTPAANEEESAYPK